MNFVERQVGEAAPPSPAASEAVRKWPIRYRSIEVFAICTDLATILFASVISTLLYHTNGDWAATNIEKAVGSAMITSALFVCLLKIYGRYRPTELLIIRDQMNAVFLAWTFV